jgi:hypothetical protein
MSTSFKAIIRKGISLEEIKTALEKKFTKVEIINTCSNDFFRFVCVTEDLRIVINVFFGDYAKNDYEIDGTLVDIGYYDISTEMMIYLCETFGGYIQEEEETFSPINFELFSQGKEYTPHDLFVNKVISTLGYDNLKKALALFEEFKKI